MKNLKTQITKTYLGYFSACLKLVIYVILCISIPSSVFAQCSLTCNNNVQISLDEFCWAEVFPDDILEGNYDPSCEPFTVYVTSTGSNYVTGNDIGQTISVSVTASNGNSCWGTINVSDYLPPIINCQTVTISCLDDPDDVNDPDVSDNCTFNPELTMTEDVDDLGCGGPYYKIITRTYTATDASGNSTSCDQIINVTRPGLNQVVFPQNLDDIQLPALDCLNPNTNPSNTGEPTIDGQSIDNVCNFSVSFIDQFFPICQNSEDILREWTVFDWCISQSIIFTQTIKILDKTAPTINCPGNQTISTGNDDCVGSIILPQANVSDDCSSLNNITVDVSASNGTQNGNVLHNLPLGITTVTYTATDDCGNSSSCVMTINVIDDVAPIVACESNHVVGLSSSTPTLVQAQTFDDGSYDLCSSVTYLARRMDSDHCPGDDSSDFSAYVPFYCCDVGNTVMVELKVTDGENNINSCMVETTVEDQINPIISCPTDITLDCNEDYMDLSITGEATVSDNCEASLTYSDFNNTGNCGSGQVSRTWTATDDSGNTASCIQDISYVNSSPFYITDTNCNNPNPNDGVIWPCDYDTNSCGPGLEPSITGEPEIFEDFCDLVAVTFEDIYLPITPPACVKVIRNWIVVDWCQYDENTGSGIWEYTQIIKVLNSEDPNILTDCNEKAFCSYDEECMEGPADLILEANDDCTDSMDLNYYYWIDIDNDGSDDYTGETNDASGTYPLGTHNILWHVEDGCGNVSICEYEFIISDCKKPTPYAYDGLALELDPNICEVTLWAIDFDAGSFDNCGIEEFRIASPSGGPGQTNPPSSGSDNVVFDSDDLGVQTVDLWVGDINGNWDYVSTFIVVQDNLGDCGMPNPSITGIIQTEEEAPVNNVFVGLDGSAPGLPDINVYTNIDGEYAFNWLPSGSNFVIAPEKDVQPLNGVTSYDLVLILKHILQIDTLDSPYKIIAADANNSGSVTALDLVEIRKIILAIDTTFSNNQSWRFVDAKFSFPNPLNPFETAIPEIFSVNGLSEEVIADFTAMKIGDVNGSAETSEFTGNSETRNAKQISFEVEDQIIEAGNSYKISLNTKDFQEISAFQFTLEFNPELIDFHKINFSKLKNLNHDNFGYAHLDNGAITSSWHQIEAVSLDDGSSAFSIQFKALKDFKLNDLFSINSSFTKAVAYDVSGNPLNIELAFSNGSEELTLHQNHPNPFKNHTTIAFDLPKSERASLRIFDVTGRVLKTIEQEFSQGYNEISVNINEIHSSGVLYYQIKTDEETQTRKMVHTGPKN